jgi:hypothetical protein
MKAIHQIGVALGLGIISLISSAQPPTPVTAQDAAPHDLTGYWVSIVTEDWRTRMMVAKAGDYQGVTLTPAGQALANAWDPSKDVSAGNACKAYGAGGLMRMPTRLHITWTDKNVLSVETDAGKQTRLLKFGSAQDGAGAGEGVGALQGLSKARWDLQRNVRGGPVTNGTVEVVTTQLAPGYLRRNGVPYSEQAKLTEFFELVKEESGDEYLIVISQLEDPLYLAQPVLTSSNFKREKNGSKWSPSECATQ